MVILRAADLTVGYGRRPVIQGIDVEILRGQFVGILGSNGCGKSTLLRTIAKMLAPVGGAVYLDGQSIRQLRQIDLARRMAVVLTDRITAGLLTAFDIVAIGRHPHTGFMGKLDDEDRRKVWEALAMVDADGLAHRSFAELSDGECQKVLIARALAQEPELIVLDEPTSHLDARHRIEVMLILRRLVQERRVAVFASLHDVDVATKVCDAVMLVKDARVVAFGAPEDVLSGETISNLYGMTRAGFSSHLGGIEFVGSADYQVFIAAGAGSGAPFYRALTRHDVGVSTGVLPENDIDYHVAQAVGATVVAERPYSAVSTETFERATTLLGNAHQVIDAGFPVGETNRANVDLIRAAVEQGKIVHTLRPADEANRLYGSSAERMVFSPRVSLLVTKMREILCVSSCGNCT